MASSYLPPRPTLPRLPNLSPGSSVGQFNTQRQGALLQGQKQPNPSAAPASAQIRITKPVTNLELGDNKVSTALDMRRQTLKNIIQNTDQQSKNLQTATAVKKFRLNQQAAAASRGGGGHFTGAVDARGMVAVGNGKYLRADAANAFAKMNAAFRAAGMGALGVTSGYRTMAEQTRLYNLYKAGKGNVAAKPGHSKHQSGIAVDINGYGGSTRSPQFRWLLQNAARFGFSWSEGKASGEPWHWVFVG